MPNLVDSDDGEREAFVVFVRKHLPKPFYLRQVFKGNKRFWDNKPVIAINICFEDNYEEDTIVANIDLSRPNRLTVFDRSFLEDFTELVEKYERYNLNVTITIVLKQPEDQ